MESRQAYLARRLEEEGKKTDAFFRGLQASQFEQTIYTDGACWNLRQVLAHQYASEEAMGRLIADILAGGSGVPEDFNLNAYNERKAAKLEDSIVEELLEKFTAQRLKTIELAKGLSDEDLDRQGRHPFLGVASVEEILKLMYRHNQIHTREIRRTLDIQAL